MVYMHPSEIIPPDAELVKRFDQLWDAAEAEAEDELTLSPCAASRIQVRVYKSICGFTTPKNAQLLFRTFALSESRTCAKAGKNIRRSGPPRTCR